MGCTRHLPVCTVPLAVLTLLLSAAVVPAQPVINEVSANHTGTDTYEYLEIFGAATTDYSDHSLLVLEGDSTSSPGTVVVVYPCGSTDLNGIWSTGFRTNEIQNGSQTMLLVQGFTGNQGDDLDSNDDGVLDASPWTAVADGVAISDGGAGDLTYTSTVLAPYFDGISYTPGGASRIPDGFDSDSIADWVRNDYDGEGLPGLGYGLGADEVHNSPGARNRPLLISELVADHAGADTHEYVEIFGWPLEDYSRATILLLEGDSGENPGQIDAAFACGTTGNGGFWYTGFLSDGIEDGSLTALLVHDFTGSVGTDLDPGDDGVLDITPWSVELDSVALDDGGPDTFYSSTVVDGTTKSLTAGGAARLPYANDTDTAGDWTIVDFDGAGLDGFPGSLVPGEAYNTPGLVNRVGVDDYYASITPGTQTEVQAALHELIDDHVRFPYTSSGTDTWDILEQADEDPGSDTEILDLYKNASYTKAGGGNSFYNREHTWPKTYGFPDDFSGNYPYTDCHQLRLSDITYNSDRGSKPFGPRSTGYSEDPTIFNNGRGGGGGDDSNWYTGSGATGIWETWIGRRGDVARTMFYLQVRYEGGAHGVRGYAEPDMTLTDSTSAIDGSTETDAYMGLLSQLLLWHAQDPVDDLERARNEAVYRYQGNRNPFVDHPDWVDCVFNNIGCDQVPVELLSFSVE